MRERRAGEGGEGRRGEGDGGRVAEEGVITDNHSVIYPASTYQGHINSPLNLT